MERKDITDIGIDPYERFIERTRFDFLLHYLTGGGIPCVCGISLGTPAAAAFHLFHASLEGGYRRCTGPSGPPVAFASSLVNEFDSKLDGFVKLAFEGLQSTQDQLKLTTRFPKTTRSLPLVLARSSGRPEVRNTACIAKHGKSLALEYHTVNGTRTDTMLFLSHASTALYPGCIIRDPWTEVWDAMLRDRQIVRHQLLTSATLWSAHLYDYLENQPAGKAVIVAAFDWLELQPAPSRLVRGY